MEHTKALITDHLLLCDDFLARIDSMAILNDSITVVNDSLFAYAGALHNVSLNQFSLKIMQI